MHRYKRDEFDLINQIIIFGCPHCQESEDISVYGFFPIQVSITDLSTDDDEVSCSTETLYNRYSKKEIIPIIIRCNKCQKEILNRKTAGTDYIQAMK